jgi:hypothetical protein
MALLALLAYCSKSLKVPPTQTLYTRDVDDVSRLYCGVSARGGQAEFHCRMLLFELKLIELRELLFVG